jgi:hypothetical protein
MQCFAKNQAATLSSWQYNPKHSYMQQLSRAAAKQEYLLLRAEVTLVVAVTHKVSVTSSGSNAAYSKQHLLSCYGNEITHTSSRMTLAAVVLMVMHGDD